MMDYGCTSLLWYCFVNFFWLIIASVCMHSAIYYSKDIACCKKSASAALHPTNLQCCCNGGTCYWCLLEKNTSLIYKITTILKWPLLFQTLPIFLDGLVTAWGAILISVTLILLFGEVSDISYILFVLKHDGQFRIDSWTF